MSFNEDLSRFFVDFGKQAIFNEESALVMFDEQDETVLHGRAQSTLYSMTYPAKVFRELRNGSPLTIDGEDFMVHGTPRLLNDGALKAATLYRPT